METVSLDPERMGHFQREVRGDPGSLRAVPLAEALRRLGRLSEAERVIRDCLHAKPGTRSAQLVLARILVDLDAMDAAGELLDELYPRDSENVALTELYARVLIAQDRFDEAQQLLERATFIGFPEQERAALLAQIQQACLDAPALTLPGAFLEPMDDCADLADGVRDPFDVARVRARLAAGAVGVVSSSPMSDEPIPPDAVDRARRLHAWATQVGVRT